MGQAEVEHGATGFGMHRAEFCSPQMARAGTMRYPKSLFGQMPVQRRPSMRLSPALTLPLVFAVAACGSSAPDTAPQADASAAVPIDAGPSAAPTRAVATLRTADGKNVGTVTLLPAGEGMRLAVQVKGLPAGEHGIHIHTTGKCEGPKFESAGAHWNPAGKKHGLENPQGSHAGDLTNLTIGADGSGITNTTLTGSTADLLDADGAALVIHAKPDDQKTDPSGDSGDRIACGVLDAS